MKAPRSFFKRVISIYIYYQTHYLYDLILFLALFIVPHCLCHEPRERKISY